MACRTAARHVMVIPDHRDDKVDKFWIEARAVLSAAVKNHNGCLSQSEAERLAAQALDTCRNDSKAALAVLMSICILRSRLEAAKKSLAAREAPSSELREVPHESARGPSTAQCSAADNAENAKPVDEHDSAPLSPAAGLKPAAAAASSARSSHSEHAHIPTRDCSSSLAPPIIPPASVTTAAASASTAAPCTEASTFASAPTGLVSDAAIESSAPLDWEGGPAPALIEPPPVMRQDSDMQSACSVPLVDSASALPCFRTQLSEAMLEGGELEPSMDDFYHTTSCGLGSWDYGSFLTDLPDVDLNNIDNLDALPLESFGQFPRFDMDQQAMA